MQHSALQRISLIFNQQAHRLLIIGFLNQAYKIKILLIEPGERLGLGDSL